MQASDRDNASLWDMVQAIKLIQEFVTPLSYEEYLNFVQEGILKHSVFKDGELIDSVMYALILDD